MIQIDMDKPANCYECKFQNVRHDCFLDPNSIFYVSWEEQYEHCPLIEVKEDEKE